MKIVLESTLGQRAWDFLVMEGKGCIIAVFSKSFYCRINDKDLLLFHQNNYGIVPFGLGFKDMESLMATLEPYPGMTFSFCNFDLFFPEISVAIIPTRVFFNTENNQKPVLSGNEFTNNIKIAEQLLWDRKSNIVENIFRLLNKTGKCVVINKSLGSEISQLWEIDVLSKLKRSIIRDSTASIRIALEKIMGMGSGLTPTMDDVLIGIAYVASIIERIGIKIMPSNKCFSNAIIENAERLTTEISSAYLKSAAFGEVYSLLEKVALSLLFSKGGDGLRENIDELLSVGSDSGGNMLVGMLLGLYLYKDCIKMIIKVSN